MNKNLQCQQLLLFGYFSLRIPSEENGSGSKWERLGALERDFWPLFCETVQRHLSHRPAPHPPAPTQQSRAAPSTAACAHPEVPYRLPFKILLLKAQFGGWSHLWNCYFSTVFDLQNQELLWFHLTWPLAWVIKPGSAVEQHLHSTTGSNADCPLGNSATTRTVASGLQGNSGSWGVVVPTTCLLSSLPSPCSSPNALISF